MGQKRQKNGEAHKRFLLDRYAQELEKTDRPFSNIVFSNGVRKLQAGCKPQEVENWVERLMRDFRRFPRKRFYISDIIRIFA